MKPRPRNSNNDLDWRMEVVGPDIYLKRKEWKGLPFFLIWSALFCGFLSLLALLMYRGWTGLSATRDPHLWWFCLMGTAIFLFLSFLIIWLGKVVLATETISTIEFKKEAGTTRLTYLGIFRRTIPDLPSKLVIGQGSVNDVWAHLAYSKNQIRPVSLLYAAGFDTDEQAKAFALEKTAEVRNLLKLEIEYGGWWRTTFTFKDRLRAVVGGCFWTVFSVGACYAAIKATELGLGRIIAGAIGILLGYCAIYDFGRAVNQKKKAGRK
jgi:hypothetical protein